MRDIQLVVVYRKVLSDEDIKELIQASHTIYFQGGHYDSIETVPEIVLENALLTGWGHTPYKHLHCYDDEQDLTQPFIELKRAEDEVYRLRKILKENNIEY